MRRILLLATGLALGGCGLLGGTRQASVPPDILRPGDALRIMVLGEDELTGTFTVDADRTVHLPLVGSVPAGGLSLVRFENDLRQVLKQGYLKDPQVLVARADPAAGTVPVPPPAAAPPDTPSQAVNPEKPVPMTPAPTVAAPPESGPRPGALPGLRRSQLNP